MKLPINRTYAGSDAATSLERKIPEIDTRPQIPVALSDGLIPIEALKDDIVVFAPLVDVPGYYSRPGDSFLLALDGKDIETSRIVLPEVLVDPVELRIPQSTMTSINDGSHTIQYVVELEPDRSRIVSPPTLFYLDREAPGGRLLPAMILPESIVLHGLSLSLLMSMPGKVVRSIIPDYKNMAIGDTLHFKARVRGTSMDVAIGALTPRGDEEVTCMEFGVDAFLLLPSNGIVDLFYLVTDKVGNASKASATTAVRIWIKDAPEEVFAPLIAGSDDGVLNDRDIRPYASIAIPQSHPAPRAGDRVELLITGGYSSTVELTAEDAARDPMLTMRIGYREVFALTQAASGPVFDADVSYTIERDGVASSSPVIQAHFNIDTPGGMDPFPDTPEHEGLPTPVMRGASNLDDNIMTAKDLRGECRILLAGDGRDARPMLREGDRLDFHLGVRLLVSVTVKSGTEPLRADLPPLALVSYLGEHELSYTVSRYAIGDGRLVSVRSPMQAVIIYGDEDLPGSGAPMHECWVPAAKRRLVNQGYYAVVSNDLESDHGLVVRIYQWSNMASGDDVLLNFQGYNAWEGGSPVQGCSGTARHLVSSEDLDERMDDSETDAPDRVFVDVNLPGTAMDAIRRGRIALSYTVSNPAGTSTTSPDNVVLVDFRW